MRDAKKWSATAYFPHVLITREALISQLNAIRQADEKLEVQVGDTVFENSEEVTSHLESLSLPLSVVIGRISIHFDPHWENRVSGTGEDEKRVSSIAKQFTKFRSPFRWTSSFLGFSLIAIALWVPIAFIFAYAFRAISKHPTDSQLTLLFLAITAVSVWIASRIQVLGANRFTRNADNFFKRYGDKIVPSVISSLITAGVVWAFSNWEHVKSIVGFVP